MPIIIPSSVHVHTRFIPVFLVGGKLSTLHVCQHDALPFLWQPVVFWHEL